MVHDDVAHRLAPDICHRQRDISLYALAHPRFCVVCAYSLVKM